ncbi:MAG: hypothetical protein AABY10_00045 [Nanoarchaeota archaeon]
MADYRKIWRFNLAGLFLVFFFSFVWVKFIHDAYTFKEFLGMSYFIGRETFFVLVLSIAGSLIATTIHLEIKQKKYEGNLFLDSLTFLIFSYVVVWIICLTCWVLLDLIF